MLCTLVRLFACLQHVFVNIILIQVHSNFTEKDSNMVIFLFSRKNNHYFNILNFLFRKMTDLIQAQICIVIEGTNRVLKSSYSLVPFQTYITLTEK